MAVRCVGPLLDDPGDPDVKWQRLVNDRGEPAGHLRWIRVTKELAERAGPHSGLDLMLGALIADSDGQDFGSEFVVRAQ